MQRVWRARHGTALNATLSMANKGPGSIRLGGLFFSFLIVTVDRIVLYFFSLVLIIAPYTKPDKGGNFFRIRSEIQKGRGVKWCWWQIDLFFSQKRGRGLLLCFPLSFVAVVHVFSFCGCSSSLRCSTRFLDEGWLVR
ncbi:hypothetical protein QBC40DRAFT_3236 [Triangularia verruculosa]|uniref:Transmembrane protein n=1 Tax=Triangularia verruculosa TaxID=2587418 RepID=A0AAN6XPG6_9PEZI|nr:hypothetical protein QBC40DRAFT_3236 [Triangularia verruculosa]